MMSDESVSDGSSTGMASKESGQSGLSGWRQPAIIAAIILSVGALAVALLEILLPIYFDNNSSGLTPTPAATPLPPPIGDNVVCELYGAAEICAWVSNGEPAQYSKVIVYGRLQIDGLPQADMPMISVWHYQSEPKVGQPPRTDMRGTASCERPIGAATVGYQVNVDVEIGGYKATTWFIPQARP